jgi:hypothetical protein
MLPKKFTERADTAANKAFVDARLLAEGRTDEGVQVRVFQGHPDQTRRAAHAIGDILIAVADTTTNKKDYRDTIVPSDSGLTRYPSNGRIDMVVRSRLLGFSVCVANPNSQQPSGIVYNVASQEVGRTPQPAHASSLPTFEVLHPTELPAAPVPTQRHIEVAPAFTEPIN